MPVVEFHLPDIGEGLAEVELVRWLVGVGDRVEENQPIADVESDKAIVTMPSPASGVVSKLCATEGDRVKVGSLLMVVDGHSSAQGAAAIGESPANVEAVPSPATAPAAASVAEVVSASPAVRRLAATHGVNLAEVQGTGPKGRITEQDVERVRDRHAGRSAAAPDVRGEVEAVPFRGIRRRIAEAMETAYRTIPHVSGFHEFDAAALVALHAERKPRAEREGIHLTYLPFIVKATVAALRAQPYLNASLDEAQGVILLKKALNIGLATSAPDGLVVPVIHHADRLGIREIARAIERLSSGARSRTLAPDDLQQGTFTITNVGAQRGWLNTSLIRHPEVAILGVGRIEERAVVRNGQVVARPIMPLVLTFDHRVVDGEQGLGFMLTLRELLEQPERLLDGEPAW
jgi:pyruvate/2-oxoglutarate dehydrogenase complex dihydrolipoamide acyltransferase (E2) component